MEAEGLRGGPASSKCSGSGGPPQTQRSSECVLLQRGGGGAVPESSASVVDIMGTPRVMKVESGAGLTDYQGAELHFLRSRVRQLERERAEMASENLRLKNMLVNEIPGLLSTMWQTLGQSSHPATPGVREELNGFTSSSYAHHHLHHNDSNNNNVAAALFSAQHQPVSMATSEDPLSRDPLSGDMSPYGGGGSLGGGEDEEEEEEEEEKVRGGEMGVAEAPPMCTQTDMAVTSRRCCSDAPPCINGNLGTHAHVGIPISSNQEREPLLLYDKVNHVEIYPGSGVSCDVRSWHAANQAQSPTAMARTLLLGVFDMNTLMNSNLRGGRSRRSTFHEQRSALDPHKINAIFNATLTRFPLARKGVIGTGINSKLSEIRFRSRRANREPRYL